MRYWLRNLGSKLEDFRWRQYILGGLEKYGQPSFFEENEKWLSFPCGSNSAKSKRALPLLQLKGSCFSKQEYLDSAWEAGTALRAPCLLSAQLDTCEMLGDHRLISMCTAAFLWEERLFISLFIMDVWACRLYYLPAHQESIPFLHRGMCNQGWLIIICCAARSTGSLCPWAFHWYTQSRSLCSLLWITAGVTAATGERQGRTRKELGSLLYEKKLRRRRCQCKSLT